MSAAGRTGGWRRRHWMRRLGGRGGAVRYVATMELEVSAWQARQADGNNATADSNISAGGGQHSGKHVQ
jgi:hypothetical protein